MRGNRGFSRVHSLRKTGVLFNTRLYVPPERRGHDIIARGSRRRELSRRGYVKIAIRERARGYTIPPNMMDRDDTRTVKGAERLVRTRHGAVRSSVFRGIRETPA